jgi:uncharacterized protein YbgA (DUF1722 family)
LKDKEYFQNVIPEEHSLSIFDIKQFVLERFEEVKTSKKMKDLVHFHTVNKFLFMAHGPNELKKLGNIVANHDDLPLSKVKELYEEVLHKIQKKSPTIKSHSNTLYHISGHFRKDLPSIEKQFIKRSIEDYISKKITLNQILGTLKFLTSKFDRTYLSRQTYFLLYSDAMPNKFGN